MKTKNENEQSEARCCSPINETAIAQNACCESERSSQPAEENSPCCDKDSMAVQKVRQSTGCC